VLTDTDAISSAQIRSSEREVSAGVEKNAHAASMLVANAARTKRRMVIS
jgi:hypothetical protein